jgi:hypothetical protein
VSNTIIKRICILLAVVTEWIARLLVGVRLLCTRRFGAATARAPVVREDG